MRITKKILSGVLVICMLASTSIISGFAAISDAESTGAVAVVTDNDYTRACESIDSEYTYTKGDLGATYSPQSTTFKVWSPTAESVSVNLYATGSDDEEGAAKLGTYDLTKLIENDKWTGVWEYTVQSDIKNVYYTYSITAKNTTGTATTTKETEDVYSTATGVNGNRSMVCDLDSTDPEGWEKDGHVLLEQSTDSSVWELHVKDFSYDENSGVSEANRGKYLAFTEEGTTLDNAGQIPTCIDYLKELGITTVQLNPVYDYGSVLESGPDSQFNWGYDPQNYNVPEGSYSSNPYDGNVRINEFKQMVQALHNAGISVVMDVVYNHTFSTNSCFQATVPNYYYRMKDDGSFSDGSGCGNEMATERAMYRDYLIQSCLYWVNEYHVDGFRFDLMAIMDVEAMNLVRDALDTVDPRITTWGEGWLGGDSYHPEKTCAGTTYYPSTQSNASKLNSRIAYFNDVIRDGIKGGAMSIGNSGFIQGDKTSAAGIMYGVRANTVGKKGWQASAPSQTVSYDSCHDNATLYDQILGSTKYDAYGKRDTTAVEMNKMAAAILYSSQGISFTLAGEEMCRSKNGDTNSYKSSPEINKIDWQNLVDYADVVSYYKGMMQIKSAFTPLTSMDMTYSSKFKFNSSLSSLTNTIAYTITNDQEGEWNKFAVLLNASNDDADITLADKEVTDWVVIANNEEAGLDNLGEVTGSTFTVPAHTAIIAVDKTGYEDAGLTGTMGKVKVNYVYGESDEKLDDTVVLQGSIGSNFQTVAGAGVPNTYVVSRVEGNTTGTFTDEVQEVTYHYTDYVPESVLKADFNGDGQVTVEDVTAMQRYFGDVDPLTDEQIANLDLNYDTYKNVSDCTMLLRYLAGIPVSQGTVVTNYYYTAADGSLKTLTGSKTVTGRVGDDYSTDEFKLVGYQVDQSKYPERVSGQIPYGETLEVNYYYIPSSLDITLHIKHSGTATWAPTMWIWGSNTKGVDTYNFTKSGTWPGDTLTEKDADGWFVDNFTYKGAGTYNLIVSNNTENQTLDYKGFVNNELWIVIDDSALSTGSYLKIYAENPDTNPDAVQVSCSIGS